jgi:uncharacterized protein
MVDELPVFVLTLLSNGDPGRARRFSSWFRALRQQTQDVRWLLAGSVGLDTVARRYNLSDTINDLQPMGLGPFEPSVAMAFLKALDDMHGLDLDEATVALMVQKVDWCIPYFLQLCYRQLRNVLEDDPSIPAEEAVERAWETLLERGRRGYFDHWRQRLHQQLGKARALQAERLLDLACRPGGARRETLALSLEPFVPDPGEREEALAFCLDVLETDGYLVDDHGRLAFRSPLLRDWWRRYHAR